MAKDFEDIGNRILAMPKQVICTYREDKKIHSVGININKDEHIEVLFKNGCVVVKTEKETKFVCDRKAFISLWN